MSIVGDTPGPLTWDEFNARGGAAKPTPLSWDQFREQNPQHYESNPNLSPAQFGGPDEGMFKSNWVAQPPPSLHELPMTEDQRNGMLENISKMRRNPGGMPVNVLGASGGLDATKKILGFKDEEGGHGIHIPEVEHEVHKYAPGIHSAIHRM